MKNDNMTKLVTDMIAEIDGINRYPMKPSKKLRMLARLQETSVKRLEKIKASN